MYPKERITADFDGLADRLLNTPPAAVAAPKAAFKLFGNRAKDPARA
jgi:hypothetical protein